MALPWGRHVLHTMYLYTRKKENLLVWKCKAEAFDIWYVALPRGQLLTKECSNYAWCEKRPTRGEVGWVGGHLFYLEQKAIGND